MRSPNRDGYLPRSSELNPDEWVLSNHFAQPSSLLGQELFSTLSTNDSRIPTQFVLTKRLLL